MNLDEDFETMLICAERHCIGRRTYTPYIVVNYIVGMVKRLSDSTLQVLRRDIISAQLYGDDMIDKPLWIGLQDRVNAELDRRSK